MNVRWSLNGGWDWILQAVRLVRFAPMLPLTHALGHHAITCRHGGDVVIRHNMLRDELADFFRRAHLSVAVEKGHGLTRDHNRQRPADLLVTGWDRGRPAAMDITVTLLSSWGSHAKWLALQHL